MLRKNNRIPRIALALVLLIVALNAFAGGWYGMAGAPNVPLEWLEGSPFRNYFFPSLFLFTVVGFSALIASILVFMRHRHGRRAALIAGAIMILWIVAQVSVIGYVSWMQPAIAGAGVLSLLLAGFSRISPGR